VADAYAEVTFRSRAEWRAWLTEHHGTARGVWAATYKKASGGPHVRYDDLVEEALAHGWIDSRQRTVDAERSALLVTLRRPSSAWSRANKERIERLLAAGLMAPAGLAAVETARANGAWSAIDAAQSLQEPDDLRASLETSPAARRHWDAFPPSTRRAILEWIDNARTPETRARRVDETARLAAQNVRANQSRQPKAK
jgi:uncharacterized protein YdeI (YjbR/CyaY-like superfamily)